VLILASGRAAHARSYMAKEGLMLKLFALFLLLLFNLGTNSSWASQLPPLDFKQLDSKSQYIILGKVKKVRYEGKDPYSGKRYDVSIEITSYFKGDSKADLVVIPLKIGGLRGFAFALEQGDLGVFFLKTLDDNHGLLTYPGSVAILKKEYFKK